MLENRTLISNSRTDSNKDSLKITITTTSVSPTRSPRMISNSNSQNTIDKNGKAELNQNKLCNYPKHTNASQQPAHLERAIMDPLMSFI
jgi:hypothetical protein